MQVGAPKHAREHRRKPGVGKHNGKQPAHQREAQDARKALDRVGAVLTVHGRARRRPQVSVLEQVTDLVGKHKRYRDGNEVCWSKTVPVRAPVVWRVVWCVGSAAAVDIPSCTHLRDRPFQAAYCERLVNAASMTPKERLCENALAPAVAVMPIRPAKSSGQHQLPTVCVVDSYT